MFCAGTFASTLVLIVQLVFAEEGGGILDFCRSRGMWIHPALALKDFPGYGRGIVTRIPLHPGTKLVLSWLDPADDEGGGGIVAPGNTFPAELEPRSLMLSVPAALRDCAEVHPVLCSAIHDAVSLPGRSSFALAMYVATRRRRALLAVDQWHLNKYILSLPADGGNALWFNDNDVEELRGSMAYSIALTLRRNLADFEKWIENGYPQLLEHLTLNDLKWSLTMLQSRSFLPVIPGRHDRLGM